MTIITEPFAICNREKTKKVILKNGFLSLNIPPLLPDELDYSFLMRTCIRNAYPNMTKFVNALFGRYEYDDLKNVRLDGLHDDYDDIFEMEYGGKFSDYTSILPLLTMFKSEESKKRIELSKASVIKKVGLRSIIESIQLCPECATRDKELYGTAYYHKAHCIPGVTVCYEHGCALEKQTWDITDGEESIIPNVSETCKPLPQAEKYAVFARKFVDSTKFISNLTKTDFQYLIQQRLRAESAGMELSLEVTKEEQSAYSEFDEIKLGKVLTEHRSLDFTTGLFLLVKVFDSPEQFISYASSYLNETAIRKDFAEGVADVKGFILERVVNRNGIRYAEIKHETCGQTFWRGISEMLTRAGNCPYCSGPRATREKFRKDFEKKYGEKFTLLNEYNSHSRPLKVEIKGTDVVLNDRPGAMMARLSWLMEDSEELNRIIETGVVRNIVVEKEKMMTFINEHFNEDEPFLSSSLPPSPDLHIIMKKLCDRGVIYRLSTGVYCRTLIELTNDELIDLKYIRNKDRRYGFDIGDRFLREFVTHCQVNPKERFIVTSPTHAVMYHDSKVQVGEITCNVYRSDEEITEDNWKVLALVLFFRHEKACTTQREDHYIPLLAQWAVKEGITEEQIRDISFNCAAQTKNNVKKLMKEVKKLWLEKE